MCVEFYKKFAGEEWRKTGNRGGWAGKVNAFVKLAVILLTGI